MMMIAFTYDDDDDDLIILYNCHLDDDDVEYDDVDYDDDDDYIHILEISDMIVILNIVMTMLYDDDGDIKSYSSISMTCVFTSSSSLIHHPSN